MGFEAGGPSFEDMGVTAPKPWKKEIEKSKEEAVEKQEDKTKLEQLKKGDHLDSATGLEFEIVDLMGVGGNGAVFKVEDRKNGFEKALKLLKGSVDEMEDEDQKRFKREINVLTKVKSPFILQAYDVDTFTVEGDEFLGFVTEVVDGHDLDQEIAEKGRLSPKDVAQHMGELLMAFETLRKAAIVHKDVKPKNVFLQEMPDGTKIAKLGDFGIVSFESLEDDTDYSRNHPDIPEDQMQNITPEGFVMGTPQFVSPEAVEAGAVKPITHKSDLYSLGLVMYQMLTGKIAIERKTISGTMKAQLNQHPQPLDLTDAATAPTWLKNVVNKLIKKDPNDRFDSAMDVFLTIKEGVKKDFPELLNEIPFMWDVKKTSSEEAWQEGLQIAV
jgi:eukaryotic-like serine/threonine-protein kinase